MAKVISEKSCTIVIPAHNEERVIGESILAIRRALEKTDRPWQIIVVDDGSTDATSEKANAAVAGVGRVIQTKSCRGKAGAIQEGILACTNDCLLFTDADLSVPPEFFEPAAERLQKADVVIASRHLPGSRLIRRQPWIRETCGEIFRILVRRFFLRDISDFTCGLKAFRTGTARKLFQDLVCRDWTFDVEVILRARKAGMTIAELPVDWSNRPDSRVRLLSAIVRSLRSLWRLRQIYG